MLLMNSIYNMLIVSALTCLDAVPLYPILAGASIPLYKLVICTQNTLQGSLLQSNRFFLPPVFFFSGSRTVLHCRLSLSFLDACFSSLHTHLSLKNDNCAAVPFKSISSYKLYLPYPSTH